ncbi:MAG: histone deacetylase [Myxococcales bacterium]|nr:histone deacetylase [Myxococcales bacterium]MCB9576702.1 histone deacetylase [Polyangiaceae bacterium]
MHALALFDDPLFSEHRPDGPHPECPERLDAARAGLLKSEPHGLPRLRLSARDASDDELGRVHDERYLVSLGQAAGKHGYLDPDTYFGPQSVAAARRAAGAAAQMVEALLDEQAGFGLALLRPPGHHARPDRAMGFCLLNNVAVAAAHARARGAERVLIVDWDVHHGNGTQEMFYADPNVLFVSLHQFPFYPGTGTADEVGEGEGRGFTVNVPLSAGADDAVYAAAFDRVVLPVAAQFDPDLVLVSAGFDAHERDPLASMALTEQGYEHMAASLAHALPRGAEGRLGLVLEGGYDLSALGASLAATVCALDDSLAHAAPAKRDLSAQHEADLARVMAVQSTYWKL